MTSLIWHSVGINLIEVENSLHLNFTIMKAKNILVGMIAAAAVGALVGTLFAPDKGEETRRKIRDTADDWMNKMKKGLRKNSVTGDMEVG